MAVDVRNNNNRNSAGTSIVVSNFFQLLTPKCKKRLFLQLYVAEPIAATAIPYVLSRMLAANPGH